MYRDPLISILMGIYNCADTLEEAVNSIKAQTYQNWELIMCDDCSTDDTYKIAKKISETDNRIILIKNSSNITLAPTLNNCFNIAKGKYIARMDGDDICDPTRLQKEIDYLDSHPEYSLVSTRMNLFDNEGVFKITTVESFPNEKDLVKGPPFCHAGCMIKKSVLKEVNGYNTDKSVERVEDYDLWYRIYRAGYRGANIQEPLYSMRDDRKATKRRKFKYRVNSFRIRKKVIKTFNLSKVYYIFALRPLVIGLIPTPLYKLIHRIGN